MAKIKEIILFCFGDSTDVSTWSNVPYLLGKTLEENGVTVRRVNISSTSKWLPRISKGLQLFARRKREYYRTPLFIWETYPKIREAVREYPDADFCIFLTFDFYNKFSGIPSLLFSDWTYRIILENRAHLKPGLFDKAPLKAEEDAITHAEIALPMFSDSYDKMKSAYPSANLHVINQNVVKYCRRKSRMRACFHRNIKAITSCL